MMMIYDVIYKRDNKTCLSNEQVIGFFFWKFEFYCFFRNICLYSVQ